MSTNKIIVNSSAGTSNNLLGSGIAGETLDSGDICYIGSNGKYFKALADSAGTASGELRVNIDAAVLNDPIVLITQGTVQSTGLVFGSQYYLSPITVGQITNTQPLDPLFSVYIGTATSATELEYNPCVLLLIDDVNNLQTELDQKVDLITSAYKILPANFDWTSIPVNYKDSVWDIRYEYNLGGANITLPSNVTLKFNKGKLTNHGTIQGDDTIIEPVLEQIFDEDADLTGTWILDNVNPRWFGAIGDGETDCSQAIRSAILFCQKTLMTLHLGNGDFALKSTITLQGNPITILGNNNGAMQNGSTLPATSLIWDDEATANVPMLIIESTYFSFIGFAVENRGEAKCFIEITNGLGYYFKDMSFVNGSRHRRFSESVIKSSGNRLGYSRFEHVYCLGAAPRFIDIDGMTTSNGITPIMIYGRSLFESNASNPMTVVYIKDETLDMLTIEDNTFNQQSGELTIVDMESELQDPKINVLNFNKNEWDTNAGSTNDRMMRLRSVDNLNMDANQLNGGGNAASLCNIDDTNITSFKGNRAKSIAGPFFTTNQSCLISGIGQNNFDLSNTQGIVDNQAPGIISMSFGLNVFLEAEKGAASMNVTHRVDVSTGDSWTLTYRNPVNGYIVVGQEVTVMIRNVSAGIISAGTFVSSFHLSAPAVAPSSGYNYSYVFVWDGSSYIEKSRSNAETLN